MIFSSYFVEAHAEPSSGPRARDESKKLGHRVTQSCLKGGDHRAGLERFFALVHVEVLTIDKAIEIFMAGAIALDNEALQILQMAGLGRARF